MTITADLKMSISPSIYEDKEHNIWFTTEGGGFSCMNASTGVISRFIPGRDIEFAIYCAILRTAVVTCG